MKTGFTLIELLLYISILAIVIFAMSMFWSTVQHQGVRSQVISEVEDQSVAPMQTISQVIRNANSISTPGPQTSSSSATIDTTVFSLSGSSIVMKDGSSAAVPLTSSRVLVSGLTFTNLSATSPGTLRIQYTVSYNNPGSMPEYTYTKNSTGSATLR